MKIVIGSDHNGFEYKERLKQMLAVGGNEIIDAGDVQPDPEDDYPKFAAQLVQELRAAGPEARGILICGSGQGMVIAANRFKGIRAALCWNVAEARASRNDDDANVLCLAARYLSFDECSGLTTVFLNTPFAGAPRFQRRIEQLDQLGG